MKKRIVSLLLALALLVLPVLPALAAEEDSYTYVALGDSITTGVGLKDTHFSSTAKSYDVQENYQRTAMWPGWPTPWAWTGTMP